MSSTSNRWIGLLANITIIAGVSIPCIAGEAAEKAAFESLYAKFKKAVRDQDTAAVLAMLDTDFVSIEISDARKNADQMLSEISSIPKNPRKESQTDVLSVEITGDFAHVTQRYHMRAPRPGADGKEQVFEVTALSTDTWERHGGDWLLQETRTDEIEMLMDGKELVHTVRPSP
jgi:ketosteroid isomerase-like protein